MITDPTPVRIGQGVHLRHGRGRRDGARRLFARIRDEIGGERGDPLPVCVLAHATSSSATGGLNLRHPRGA